MKYVITVPTYNKASFGHRVLYELQKCLVRYNKDAIILNFSAPYIPESDDIVVYPEIVKGNPLKAKNVVRYILNVPGKLGGDKNYDKNEILFAYDLTLSEYSDGNILTIPIDDKIFYNKQYKKTINCLWVGKGTNIDHDITTNCVNITYNWPVNQIELAELLNKAKTLYTYDDRSSIINEAQKCGCEVKLIKDNLWTFTDNSILGGVKDKMAYFLTCIYKKYRIINNDIDFSVNVKLLPEDAAGGLVIATENQNLQYHYYIFEDKLRLAKFVRNEKKHKLLKEIAGVNVKRDNFNNLRIKYYDGEIICYFNDVSCISYQIEDHCNLFNMGLITRRLQVEYQDFKIKNLEDNISTRKLLNKFDWQWDNVIDYPKVSSAIPQYGSIGTIENCIKNTFNEQMNNFIDLTWQHSNEGYLTQTFSDELKVLESNFFLSEIDKKVNMINI